jgi:hypothetical protein
MSTLVKPETTPEPVGVTVTEDTLSVDLADGRSIAVPLGWFPRLRHGTPEEWANYELGRVGIHWPELDEDVSVEGLLKGEKSAETPQSVQRWIDRRRQQGKLVR